VRLRRFLMTPSITVGLRVYFANQLPQFRASARAYLQLP
jgi:hypothetical protein